MYGTHNPGLLHDVMPLLPAFKDHYDNRNLNTEVIKAIRQPDRNLFENIAMNHRKLCYYITLIN